MPSQYRLSNLFLLILLREAGRKSLGVWGCHGSRRNGSIIADLLTEWSSTQGSLRWHTKMHAGLISTLILILFSYYSVQIDFLMNSCLFHHCYESKSLFVLLFYGPSRVARTKRAKGTELANTEWGASPCRGTSICCQDPGGEYPASNAMCQGGTDGISSLPCHVSPVGECWAEKAPKSGGE